MTPTLTDIRRLAAAANGKTPASAWNEIAVNLVALLHSGALDVTEEEHTELCREALAVADILLGRDLPPDDRGMVSDFASTVLLAEFIEEGDQDDLDAAVEIRRAEAGRAEADLGCAANVNLASALMTAFDHDEAASHLAEAAEALGSASRFATNDGQRAIISGARGNLHSRRYDLHRDRADLDAAVREYENAAQAPDASVRARARSSLASLLWEHCREGGGESHLIDAERHARAALSEAPEEASARRYGLLARILRDRHQRDGVGDRLDEAEEIMDVLLGSVPPDSPERADLVGTASSIAYSRYLVRHERTVLDEAIRLTDEALDGYARREAEGGTSDRQDRAVLANQICLLLTELFTLDGVRDHIDRAVGTAESCLAGPLPHHLDHGLRTNLANALHRRFESYGERRDLQAGIREARRVAGRARGAGERATALHILALLLGDKARMSGLDADFDEAIARVDEEIRLTPRSSTELPPALVNKADLISGRVGADEAAGDDPVVAQLIEILEDAWSLSPEPSALRARAAYQLGYRYAQRSGFFGLAAGADEPNPALTLSEEQAADLRRAMTLWNEAVALDEPFVMIEAGQRLGDVAFTAERWDGAALGYRAALDAADRLVDRRTLAVDRQLARFQVQGVAAAAGLAALKAGSPRDAVLCLEQGTATLLARTMGRRAKQVDYDDVVAAAQTLGGPLVYWAATLAGGFAIVVCPDGEITSAPLPLTTAEVENRLAGLRAAFSRQQGEDVLDRWADAVQDLLGWVWETAVKPVVHALDGHPTAGLVPVGRLASLPLAASSPPRGDPLLARTVPRLFPDSGAVRSASPWRGAPEVVLVCDPGEGRRWLRHAVAEADRVAARHPGARRVAVARDGAELTTRGAGNRVLRARGLVPGTAAGASGPAGDPGRWTELIGAVDIAHVICHYDLDPDEPLRSVLRLGDGITVADLLDRRLPGSPHLVLSACDTGLGGARLPDEAIGIGTVLLSAGARSVVASLWPLDDELAAGFMDAYHRRLAAGNEPAAALAAVQRDAAHHQRTVVWPGLVHMG